MKKEKEWMPQNKGLREKLYVVIVILLVIVLLISVWQLGRYLIDGWKSRTFSEDLQEFVIFDDERELKNEVTDQKQEEEPAEQEQAIPAFIDFDNLYEMGENAVAWLYCPDTEINYVIAQAEKGMRRGRCGNIPSLHLIHSSMFCKSLSSRVQQGFSA